MRGSMRPPLDVNQFTREGKFWMVGSSLSLAAVAVKIAAARIVGTRSSLIVLHLNLICSCLVLPSAYEDSMIAQ